MGRSAPALFEQLAKAIEGKEGQDVLKKIKGLIVFDTFVKEKNQKVSEKQTLDLREGKGKTYSGMPENDEKPDLTVTISDDDFAKLVMGKLGPQQAFIMGKLKIAGSMALAMKLQPILQAAAPKAKL